MPQNAARAMRDFAELVSLGTFVVMIALVARALGA